MRRRITVLLAVAASLLLTVPAQAAPPAADPPTGLRVTGATATSVSLAWNAAPGATGYQVLRGTPTTSLAVVATAGSSTTYTDTGRSPGTTYVYAVTAVRKTKVSAPSATVTVTTVPPAPTGLFAEARSATEVFVGWSSTAGATSYDVFRATGGGTPVLVTTVSVAVPAGSGGAVPAPGWLDTTVSPATTYSYTVRAANTSGASASSAGASVTTPAIAKPTPAVSITSSSNPAQHGDHVVFTVRVTSSEGTSVPSGAVQVRLANQTVDAVLDSTGTATFDWVFNQDNDYLVTAAYQGDARYAAANGSLTQSVQQSPRLNPYLDFATGSWPESVVAADVNGDGRHEAVIATTYYDSVNDYSLLVHDFVLGTAPPVVTRVPAGTSYTDSGQAAAGDLDADGFDDVVLTSDEGVRVFHGSPDGLQPGVLTASTGSVRDVVVSDVTGDGLPDVVVSVKGPQGAYAALLAGKDGRRFAAEVRVTTVRNVTPVLAAGDLTGDGVADVVALWSSSRGLEVVTDFALPFGGSGNWDTWTYQTLPGTARPSSLAVGDVDSDGLQDVVVTAGGNEPDSRILVLPRISGGTLGAGYALLGNDVPEAVAVADVDGDDRADVVVAHGGHNTVGVYRQNNRGQLSPEQLFPVSYASHYGPRALAVGDVTGNGLTDILLADHNNGLVMLGGR